MAGPTTIPNYAADDFAQRVIALLPQDWFSDSAKAPGGVLYALLHATGGSLAAMFGNLAYTNVATRIKTAVGAALDAVSVDFFGPYTLPRRPNESDAAFRVRILANLLLARVTRPAIAQALFLATGEYPRMGEPTFPGDCAAYDANSYYGMDGPEDVAPARFGDVLPYTGFIDMAAPYFVQTGGYPVYAYDIGAAYDVPASAYDLTGASTSIQSDQTFAVLVDSTVQAFKAFGTVIGVRLTSQASLAPYRVGALAASANGISAAQSDMGAAFAMRNWLQSFGVWIETPSWNTTIWTPLPGVNFVAEFGAPAIAAATLGWIAGIYTTTAFPAMRIGVNQNQSSITIKPPGGMPAGAPIVMADFNTTVWVQELTASALTLGVGTAGPGNLDLMWLTKNWGRAGAAAGVTAITVPLPAGISGSYAVFATPNWNTSVWTTKGANSFTLNFSNPAPGGQTADALETRWARRWNPFYRARYSGARRIPLAQMAGAGSAPMVYWGIEQLL